MSNISIKNNNNYQYGANSKGALGRGGVIDWLVQRKTAILIAFYTIYISYFFVTHKPLEYIDWLEFFSPIICKIITLIILFSIIKHAWIGLWTIATDYLHNIKIRSLFLFITKTLLFVYLVWGIYILFSF